MIVDVEHRSFEDTLARCAEIGGVDLIFTSPPYPTEVPGAKGREGAPTRRYGGDAPEHFLWPDYQRLGDACFAALKPGGFCIVIVDGPVRTRDKKKGSERSLIAFKLAIDWAERVGLRYVEHEAYLRLGPPGDFGPRRRSGFELMHVFQKPGARGYFDAWAVTIPARRAGLRKKNACGARMWNGKIDQGKAEQSHFVQPDRRTASTAINAAGPAGPMVSKDFADIEHPAPFTRFVAEVQVRSYCQPGGLVCDPFNGSGTTGIAAVKYGRNFVGGDLGVRERDGRRWADIGRERALAERPATAAVDRARDDGAPAEPTPPRSGQLDLLVE